MIHNEKSGRDTETHDATSDETDSVKQLQTLNNFIGCVCCMHTQQCDSGRSNREPSVNGDSVQNFTICTLSTLHMR